MSRCWHGAPSMAIPWPESGSAGGGRPRRMAWGARRAQRLHAGLRPQRRSFPPARGLQVSTLVCDAARIPVPDDWADTVSVIHLLEHVSPEHGSAVLSEALRV